MNSTILSAIGVSAALGVAGSAIAQPVFATQQSRSIAVEAIIQGDNGSDSGDDDATSGTFGLFDEVRTATASTQFDGDLIMRAAQTSDILDESIEALLIANVEDIATGPFTIAEGAAESYLDIEFDLISGGKDVAITGTLFVDRHPSNPNVRATVSLEDSTNTVIFSETLTDTGSVDVDYQGTLPDGIYTLKADAVVFMTQDHGLDSARTDIVLELVNPCQADINGDGVLAVGDILDFLALWSGMTDPRGDFSGDGIYAVGDILDFLAAWSAGCP